MIGGVVLVSMTCFGIAALITVLFRKYWNTKLTEEKVSLLSESGIEKKKFEDEIDEEEDSKYDSGSTNNSPFRHTPLPPRKIQYPQPFVLYNNQVIEQQLLSQVNDQSRRNESGGKEFVKKNDEV